ncbi:MAG: amidohydrolase family protein [Planctomycetota bacterium]
MVIDIHVHIAGTGNESDCHMSEALRKSPAYLLMLLTTGQIFGKVNDQAIRKHLLETLSGSELVDRAVFLALDAIPDIKGRPDLEQSHLYTPNDYVADIAEREPKVLFGASVHPDRPDACDELERVAARGAVLNKWIPSSQAIDPRRKRYLKFYRKLAELGLPLLCHAGAEHAVPAPEPEKRHRKLDNPGHLREVLDAGVTVIVAHCAMPVFASDPDYTQDFIALMRECEHKEWKLFADVSALAGPFPHRVGLLKKVVDELPHDRLLLGSDYPIPVSPLWPGAAGEINVKEWGEAALTMNPLDRNVKMVRALGFSAEVLTNAEKILRLPA